MTEDKSDSETSDTVEAFTASISSAPHQMDKWLTDSGASSHMQIIKCVQTKRQSW